METKCQDPKLKKQLIHTYLHNVESVPPTGSSGGLALFWSDNIALRVLGKSHNFVLTEVTEQNGFIWLLLLIYNHPRK